MDGSSPAPLAPWARRHEGVRPLFAGWRTVDSGLSLGGVSPGESVSANLIRHGKLFSDGATDRRGIN
jgi:hypothetical protein